MVSSSQNTLEGARSPFHDRSNWYMPFLRVPTRNGIAQELEKGRLYALRSGWGGRARLQRLVEELAKANLHFVSASDNNASSALESHGRDDDESGDAFYTLEKLGQRCRDSRHIAWSRLCPVAPSSLTPEEPAASVAELVGKTKEAFFKEHLTCQDTDWASQVIIPVDVASLQSKRQVQSGQFLFGNLQCQVCVDVKQNEDQVATPGTPQSKGGRDRKRGGRNKCAPIVASGDICVSIRLEQPAGDPASQEMWVLPQVYWEVSLLSTKDAAKLSVTRWGMAALSRFCNVVTVPKMFKLNLLLSDRPKKVFTNNKSPTCYIRVRLISRFMEPLVTCMVPGDFRKRRLGRVGVPAYASSSVQDITPDDALERLESWSPLTSYFISPLASPNVATATQKIANALNVDRRHEIKLNPRLHSNQTLPFVTESLGPIAGTAAFFHPRYHHEQEMSLKRSFRAQMSSIVPLGDLGCLGSVISTWSTFEPIIHFVLNQTMIQFFIIEGFAAFDARRIIRFLKAYATSSQSPAVPSLPLSKAVVKSLGARGDGLAGLCKPSFSPFKSDFDDGLSDHTSYESFSEQSELEESTEDSESDSEELHDYEEEWSTTNFPHALAIDGKELPTLQILLIALVRQAMLARLKQPNKRVAQKWIFRIFRVLAELKGLRAALDVLDPQTLLQYLRCCLVEACSNCALSDTIKEEIKNHLFVHEVALIKHKSKLKDDPAEGPNAYQVVESQPQMEIFVDGHSRSMEFLLKQYSEETSLSNFCLPDGYTHKVSKTIRCVLPTELSVQFLTERKAFQLGSAGDPFGFESHEHSLFTVPELVDVSRLAGRKEACVYALTSMLVALPRIRGEVNSGKFVLFSKDLLTSTWSCCMTDEHGAHPVPQSRLFVEQMELHQQLSDQDLCTKLANEFMNLNRDATFQQIAEVTQCLYGLSGDCATLDTNSLVMSLREHINLLCERPTILKADPMSAQDELVPDYHFPAYWTFSEWFVPMGATFVRTTDLLNLCAMSQIMTEQTRRLNIIPFFFEMDVRGNNITQETLFRRGETKKEPTKKVANVARIICHLGDKLATSTRPLHSGSRTKDATNVEISTMKYFAFGNFSFGEGIDIQNPSPVVNDVLQYTNKYDWSIEIPCLDDIVTKWEQRSFPPVFVDPSHKELEAEIPESYGEELFMDPTTSEASEDEYVESCSCDSDDVARETDRNFFFTNCWRGFFKDQVPKNLADIEGDDFVISDEESDEGPAILCSVTAESRMKKTGEKPIIMASSICHPASQSEEELPTRAFEIWNQWALEVSLAGNPFMNQALGSNVFRSFAGHPRKIKESSECALCGVNRSEMQFEVLFVDEWQLFGGCNPTAFKLILSGTNRVTSQLLKTKIKGDTTNCSVEDVLSRHLSLSENFDVALPFMTLAAPWSSTILGDGAVSSHVIAEMWARLPVALRLTMGGNTTIHEVSTALLFLQKNSVLHNLGEQVVFCALTATWDEAERVHRVSWVPVPPTNNLVACASLCNSFLVANEQQLKVLKHPQHHTQRLYFLPVRKAGSLLGRPYINTAVCSQKICIGLHRSPTTASQITKLLEDEDNPILHPNGYPITLPEQCSVLISVKAFFPRHQGFFYLGNIVVKTSHTLGQYASLFDSVLDRRLIEMLEIRRGVLVTLKEAMVADSKDYVKVAHHLAVLNREIAMLETRGTTPRGPPALMIFEELHTNILRPIEQAVQTVGDLFGTRKSVTIIVQRLAVGYSLCPICQKPITAELAVIRHYGACSDPCEVVARLAVDVRDNTPMRLGGETQELAAIPEVLLVTSSAPELTCLGVESQIIGEYRITEEEQAHRPVWEMVGGTMGVRRLVYDGRVACWKIIGQLTIGAPWTTCAISENCHFSVAPSDLPSNSTWFVATVDGFIAYNYINIIVPRNIPEAPVTLALSGHKLHGMPKEASEKISPFAAIFRRLKASYQGRPVYVKVPSRLSDRSFERTMILFDGATGRWSLVLRFDGVAAVMPPSADDLLVLAQSEPSWTAFSPDSVPWPSLQFEGINPARLWRPAVLTVESNLSALPSGEYVLPTHPSLCDVYIYAAAPNCARWTKNGSGSRSTAPPNVVMKPLAHPSKIAFHSLEGAHLQYYTTTAEAEAFEGCLNLMVGERNDGTWMISPPQVLSDLAAQRQAYFQTQKVIFQKKGYSVKSTAHITPIQTRSPAPTPTTTVSISAVDEVPVCLHLIAWGAFQPLGGTYFLMESLYSFRPVYVKLLQGYIEDACLDKSHWCPLKPADIDVSVEKARAEGDLATVPTFLYFSSVSETWRLSSQIGSGFAFAETPEVGDFSFPPYRIRCLANISFTKAILEIRDSDPPGDAWRPRVPMIIEQRGLNFESCVDGKPSPIFLFHFHDTPKVRCGSTSTSCNPVLDRFAAIEPAPAPFFPVEESEEFEEELITPHTREPQCSNGSRPWQTQAETSRRRRVRRLLWQKSREMSITGPHQVPLPCLLRERALRARTAEAAFSEYLKSRNNMLTGEVGRRLFESAAKTHRLLKSKGSDESTESTAEIDLDAFKKALFFFGRDAALGILGNKSSKGRSTNQSMSKAGTTDSVPPPAAVRRSELPVAKVAAESKVRKEPEEEKPQLSVEQILAMVGDSNDECANTQKRRREKKKKKKKPQAVDTKPFKPEAPPVKTPASRNAQKAVVAAVKAPTILTPPVTVPPVARPTKPAVVASKAKVTDPLVPRKRRQKEAILPIDKENEDAENDRINSTVIPAPVKLVPETPSCGLDVLKLGDCEIRLGEMLLEEVLTHRAFNCGQLSLLINKEEEMNVLMNQTKARLRSECGITKISLSQLIQQRLVHWITVVNGSSVEAVSWPQMVTLVATKVARLMQKATDDMPIPAGELLIMSLEESPFLGAVMSNRQLIQSGFDSQNRGYLLTGTTTREEILVYMLLASQQGPDNTVVPGILELTDEEVAPAFFGIRLGQLGGFIVELFDRREESAAFTFTELEEQIATQAATKELELKQMEFQRKQAELHHTRKRELAKKKLPVVSAKVPAKSRGQENSGQVATEPDAPVRALSPPPSPPILLPTPPVSLPSMSEVTISAPVMGPLESAECLLMNRSYAAEVEDTSAILVHPSLAEMPPHDGGLNSSRDVLPTDFMSKWSNPMVKEDAPPGFLTEKAPTSNIRASALGSRSFSNLMAKPSLNDLVDDMNRFVIEQADSVTESWDMSPQHGVYGRLSVDGSPMMRYDHMLRSPINHMVEMVSPPKRTSELPLHHDNGWYPRHPAPGLDSREHYRHDIPRDHPPGTSREMPTMSRDCMSREMLNEHLIQERMSQPSLREYFMDKRDPRAMEGPLQYSVDCQRFQHARWRDIESFPEARYRPRFTKLDSTEWQAQNMVAEVPSLKHQWAVEAETHTEPATTTSWHSPVSSISPPSLQPMATSLRTLGYATRHLGREFDTEELNVLDEIDKIWDSSFFVDE